MSVAQFDVIVVGAGCAGLTAALGLARSGFTVAVLEATPFPGANGIGGVCFAESLAESDLLGPQGVDALCWERRLIGRGRFATDGRRLFGCTYRDADAFRHCFTVLRPLFDHHLAQIALSHGVALVTETTVEGLIRTGRRVIGVATSRGPLYADLVFLAEGDAGHLVSREGFDRFGDPRESPSFLYCLQQVIDLPPGAIEESFQVGPEQGIAYEILLRNPRWAALNARGLVCTNRQSVTLSVLLPADNLRQHFHGEPRQLLDWFAGLPALRPWWREGRRGAWTAQLVRAGGLRDVPYLADDGVAIGGAAAGLGIDFPVWNSTGPAFATGLQLCRAAVRIRSEGGFFDRESLRRHYVEPLRQTRSWRDVEFLQRWPGYLKRTRVLCDRELDLVLDSAAVWTRPRRWLPRKLLVWFRLLGRVRWAEWGEMADDVAAAGHALRFREVTPRPALGRVLLDGALNAFRDLVRRPRPHLPPAGRLHFYYYSTEDSGTVRAAPTLLSRWFARFEPVLASAGHIFTRNDDKPLSARMTAIIELLIRQVNLLDLLALAGLAFLTAVVSTLLDGGAALFRRLLRRRETSAVGGATPMSASAEVERNDATRPSARGPLIHLIWRSTDPHQRADTVQRLPHICPTSVFETQGHSQAVVQVRVRAEKCIACEACWRLNPFVDWGHPGARRLRTAVLSPLVSRLLEAEDQAGLSRPTLPRRLDPWFDFADFITPRADAAGEKELTSLLDQFAAKLSSFEHSLTHGPAVIDRPSSDHLEMLARYAQQLAARIREALDEARWMGAESTRQRMLERAAALHLGAEERAKRTWDGRFAWAAADGRLLRQHSLAGLRRLLGLHAFSPPSLPADPSRALRPDWIPQAMALRSDDACLKHLLADIAARRYLLETLELARSAREDALRAELLVDLAAEVQDGLAARMTELHFLLGNPGEDAATNTAAASKTYDRHGRALLTDAGLTHSLLTVPGDWPLLAQRRALQAEQDEIVKAEERLAALVSEWRRGERDDAAKAEVGAGFARQVAHLLADKLLLLRTFDRLEKGLDAELAISLLRVWLDYTTTLLDEFTILVSGRLLPPHASSARPLVEFGSGPPLRTLAEYLAAPAPRSDGDFLLLPVDLLQPRLVPEMISSPEEIRAAIRPVLPTLSEESDKSGSNYPVANPSLEELVQDAAELRELLPSLPRREETLYLAETLAVQCAGRHLHPQTRSLDGDLACARLIVMEAQQKSALRERCQILRALAEEVVPRWLRGDIETRVRHLGREVLELEALKEEFRRRLTAVWQTCGEALGRNADVQASCFALAEAAAWLKAADSVLGRLAWLGRLAEAEEREEPAARSELGRRVLAHCQAEVRDRLFRFEEDLAALRRGYYAPHVRAASLLRMPEPPRPTPPLAHDIRRPIRVLVIVEPSPAALPNEDEGERVLESFWTLHSADRAALEIALRLHDAEPQLVQIEVAAVGPPRVGQALREVLSLGIENVHLLIPDREDGTSERGAAVLATALRSASPFELILGAQRETHLVTHVAEALGVSVVGHAAEVAVQACSTEAHIRLPGGSSHSLREFPLPAAVLIEAGIALRSFTLAGYLAGLARSIQTVGP